MVYKDSFIMKLGSFDIQAFDECICAVTDQLFVKKFIIIDSNLVTKGSSCFCFFYNTWK